MKNWNWKQWTGFGIVGAVAVTSVVLHLVQPTVSYAWTEVMSLAGFGIGLVAGYMFKRND